MIAAYVLALMMWAQQPTATKFDSGYGVVDIVDMYPAMLSEPSLPMDECSLPYVVCPTSATVTIIDPIFTGYGGIPAGLYAAALTRSMASDTAPPSESQQPSISPAADAYMFCKPGGGVDVYGWGISGNLALGDELFWMIVRDYPERTYGNCSKWMQQAPCQVDAIDVPNCLIVNGRPLVIFKAATPQAEAIDVPAVQVTSMSEIVMRGDIMTCSNHGTLTITQSQNECANGFTWTCDDKSRGLWHSEDGHYWCHRTQPETPPQPTPMHCGPAIVWPSDDLSDGAGQKVRICHMEEQ